MGDRDPDDGAVRVGCAVRLTQPQAVALAHWTPGVAALRPLHVGGPSLVSIRALVARGLLADCHGVGWHKLTPAGCAEFAHLIATEAVVIPAGCVRLHSDGETCGAGCYRSERCRIGMSRLEGGKPPHVVAEALAWAPTAEACAAMSPGVLAYHAAGANDLYARLRERAARMGRAERDATRGGAAMATRR